MIADSRLVGTLSPSPNFGDRQGRRVDALILHYTGMRTGETARDRLLDPASQVSCHYLVWEDGRIEQHVAEASRAWHAGRSFWAGERDMNSVSIGIEIVNGGHDFGCPPYPARQIDAVVDLARDVCARHAVPPTRVLGHSDIAPDRKRDPGEWFPWAQLVEAGVSQVAARGEAPRSSDGDRMAGLQRNLRALGHDCPLGGGFDAATACIVAAFQRRHRPARVDGIPDRETLALLAVLAEEARRTS